SRAPRARTRPAGGTPARISRSCRCGPNAWWRSGTTTWRGDASGIRLSSCGGGRTASRPAARSTSWSSRSPSTCRRCWVSRAGAVMERVTPVVTKMAAPMLSKVAAPALARVPEPEPPRVVPKLSTVLAVGGVASGVSMALASLGVATYFARRVVTPEHEKKDDTWIVSIDDEEAGQDTITMVAAPHTLSPGRYGLWLERGAGHARVGDVVSSDLSARKAIDRTVVRELIDVDEGDLDPGPARWNSYYYCGDPGSAVGLDFDDVWVPSDIGDLPAWLVPPRSEEDRPDEWAVLVHGRSAKREETIRALPVLHDLGFTSLVPMYRNDLGAPPSVDGRYNL